MLSTRSSLSLFRHARTALTSLGAAVAVTLLAGLPGAGAWAASLDTSFGKVEVSSSPQRIITLDEGALDTALAMGLKPVGSVAARGGTELPAYLQDKAGDIAIVGTTREPNLEAVLAQRPDLILASPGLEKRVYDVLSRIAPTIVPDVAVTAPWAERNALYGAALGKSEEMAAREAAVQARIAALRERMPQGESFSVVRWNPQGPLAMSSELIAGQLLTALGMQPTKLAVELGGRPHSDILSLENLGSVDADWLFIATLNEQGEATLAAARKQPAFNRLEAVRNDRSILVDGQVWTSATGILAAERILDDIERLMAR